MTVQKSTVDHGDVFGAEFAAVHLLPDLIAMLSSPVSIVQR